MSMLSLALLIAAFVLFLVVAFGATYSRFNLTGAGLACWALSELIARLMH